MSEFLKKLYAWCLNKVRFVAGAIIGFLPRVLPNKKKSVAFLKRVFLILAMMLFMCPVIMRVGGGSTARDFDYTFSGISSLIDDGDGHIRIKFLSSGTVVFNKDMIFDIFCVGGGGSGACGGGGAPGYGGGGYTNTYSSIVLYKDVEYTVTIGAGGAAVDNASGANGIDGGKTWFVDELLYYANGGVKGTYRSSAGKVGGDGGSGGSALGSTSKASNGADGYDDSGYLGGDGQGTTTREFGETTGDLYSHGGAKGDGNQADNTGNGSGTTNNSSLRPGYAAGSGIVVIRDHRETA